MAKKKHHVYVYGTLRPGGPIVHILSGKMYSLGGFPGVRLPRPEDVCVHTFVAEKITVDDRGLAELDRYEGYDPNEPSTSLYLRVPCRDGWIYEYNMEPTASRFLPNGDWLEATQSTTGRAARIFKLLEEVKEEQAEEIEEDEKQDVGASAPNVCYEGAY